MESGAGGRMTVRRRPMSEINVVPYIDVMLVLLVIFMATAPLLTQGVDVDLPNVDSKPLPTDEEDPLVISVDDEGRIFVNTGMPREGPGVDPGTRVTIFSLEDQVGKIVRARPDIPVYVRGDQGVAYGQVMRVMSVLQRAGKANVGLMTDPVEDLAASSGQGAGQGTGRGKGRE